MKKIITLFALLIAATACFADGISGSSSLCRGSNTNFTGTPAGGTWWSGSPGIAAVGSDGTVSGVAAGTTAIFYSIGSDTFSAIITVDTLPVVDTLVGNTIGCEGDTITLTDASPGGVWSVQTNRQIDGDPASIDGGVLIADGAGVYAIRYSVSNTCGTSYSEKLATIMSAPNPYIAFSSQITQVGDSVHVYAQDLSTGGAADWSTLTIGDGTIATLRDWLFSYADPIYGPDILHMGTVTGIAAGTTLISYTEGNACGPTLTYWGYIDVQPRLAIHGPSCIPGADTICLCQGSTITITATYRWGGWNVDGGTISLDYSDDTYDTVATITGLTPGISFVSYYAMSRSVTRVVRVLPSTDVSISGPATMCTGTSALFSTNVNGGTWSVSDATIATVDQNGVVTALSAGSVTVHYSIPASCGNTNTSTTIHIIQTPYVNSMVSPGTVCSGTTVNVGPQPDGVVLTVGDGSTFFIVDAQAGLVFAALPGTTTITAVFSGNACGGTVSSVTSGTVITVPAVSSIVGTDTICVGATAIEGDLIPGGEWRCLFPTILSIAPTSTSQAIVTGIHTGYAPINYTDSNMCGTSTWTKTIYVDGFPDSAVVSGPHTVAVGNSISISANPAGGNLTSSGGLNISQFNLSDPSANHYLLTGASAGITFLQYSKTNSCGAGAPALDTIIVNGLLKPLNGSDSLCAGGTAQLSDTTTGGTWSSSNASVAHVDGTGLVSGVSAGSATITYTLGSQYVTAPIFVKGLPTAGTISGTDTICNGATTSLSESVPGGVWSSGAANLSINSAGVVTGTTAGTGSISYTATNSCGSSAAYYSIAVISSPDPGVISGPAAVCVGTTISLSESVAGGSWTSSNAHAAVNSAGIVSGISTGSAVISYTVTNSCGSAYATKTISVNAYSTPTVSAITGPASVCAGVTIAMADATPGGTWSSSNSSVAVVSSGGLVTGVNAGSAIISYTVANACTSATAQKTITISPQPLSPHISGPGSVCVASAITLASSPSGTWSRVGSAGTVSATGVVTGLAAGSIVIKNTISNSCGSRVDSVTIIVKPLPIAGTISGAATVCEGVTIPLTDAATGGVWSVTPGTGNASILPTGALTGVAAGTVTVSYSVTNSCGSATAVKTVTVNPQPATPHISGPGSVCVASAITLTSIPSGTWSRVGSAALVSTTGVVTGVTAGSVIIKNTISNSCGSRVDSVTINVNPLPGAGTISGAATVCEGVTISLTDAATGGVWSVTPGTGNASILPTGALTGITAGTVTVSYTVTNSCGSASALKTVTVNPQPATPHISGPGSVCVASAITLTSSPSGTWSRVGSAASVSTTGVVTGVTAGSVIIKNTISNSCGSRVDSVTIIVNPLPVAGTISGAATVCEGVTISLTDGATGGLWSVTPGTGNAGVSPTGALTGITAGTVSVSYTVTNSCGSATAVKTVTVNPQPATPHISGPGSVCVASAITLTSSPSGTWSRVGTAASVSTTGVVTGVAAGSVVIKNTISNSCGSRVDSVTITVNPLSVVAAISGATSVCVGSSTNYTDPTPGGLWHSSYPAIAAVSATGVVTGLTSGSATISYTITNGCGSVSALKVISVNPLPVSPMISGSSAVCVGTTIALTSSPAGIWSRAGSAGTVSATGVVTGVSAGTVKIKSTISNSCGSRSDSVTITVHPALSAGTIAGPSTVCQGASIALTDAVGGGVWNAGNTFASVSGGSVTGISAGVDTISYSVSNAWCTAVAKKGITVNPLPDSGVISGAGSACPGTNIALTESVPGGAWSSSGIASVTASGIVSAASAGSAIITYAVTNSCGTTRAYHSVTFNPLPHAGTVSGASACVGISIPVSATVSGGSWISGGSASIDGSGNATSSTAGTSTIYYIVSNSCGSDTATTSVTFNPLPDAGTISGPSSVCVDASIGLATSGTGGNWSSTGAASVSGAGSVFGLYAGTVAVYYTVTNSCGTDIAAHGVTVNDLPHAGVISGASSVCVASSTGLSVYGGDAGGTWSSSGSASVDGSGNVYGISAGSATVAYTVTNGCGTDAATYSLTVMDLPHAGIISGPSTVSVGSAISLASTSPGGTWSSTTPFLSVNTSGVVSGIAAGTGMVTYTVTNTCGVNYVSWAVTVNSGAFLSFCVGSTHQFTASGSGTWVNAADPQISLTEDGLATGQIGGWGTVYFVPDDGSPVIEYDFGVMQDPSVSDIEVFPSFGPLNIGETEYVTAIAYGCQFGTLGETWSYSYTSSDPSVATITPDGYLTAVAPGWTVINYSVTNICGSGTGHGGREVRHPLAIIGSAYCDSFMTDTICLCQSNFAVVESVRGTTEVNAEWSSDNGIVTIVHLDGESFATLTGWAPGIANVTACDFGNCVTRPVRVIQNPLLPIPVIIGDTTVNVGATTILHCNVSDGWWMLTDTTNTIAAAAVYGNDLDITGIAPGYYTVYYRDSNQCAYNTALFTIKVVPLGARSAGAVSTGTVSKAGSVEIFPNPTSGNLNIKWLSPLMGMAETVVTDITGREVYKDVWEMKSVSGTANADLSKLQTGVYFVTVRSEDINYSTRVTIDK